MENEKMTFSEFYEKLFEIKSPSEHIRERGDNVANDLKSIFAFILGAFSMPPDGGYGGIDMCITCKKNGMDKYKDEETGQEWDLCERCPNNMTNAYKGEKQ